MREGGREGGGGGGGEGKGQTICLSREQQFYRGEGLFILSIIFFLLLSFYTSLNYCSAILRESELPQPTH